MFGIKPYDPNSMTIEGYREARKTIFRLKRRAFVIDFIMMAAGTLVMIAACGALAFVAHADHAKLASTLISLSLSAPVVVGTIGASANFLFSSPLRRRPTGR